MGRGAIKRNIRFKTYHYHHHHHYHYHNKYHNIIIIITTLASPLRILSCEPQVGSE